MLRCVRLLGVLLVAGIVASGASAMEETIFPGVGIGKLKLGMTRAQVVRMLGKGYTVNANTPAYTELGWNFSSWTVRIKDGRTVEVGTSLRNEKTSKKVGPGAFWQTLVRAYPGGACTFNNVDTTLDGTLEYLVARKGGTQTLFTLHPWPVRAYYGASPKTYFVTAVAVRTRYQAQPEFAGSYPYKCRDGWKTTKLPQHNN